MRWQQIQEQTAEFFRSLGCDAQVEAKVAGARAEHKIDVWVLFKKFGLETKWVVECKDWSSPIPKEKVLALKTVVEDVGADRGILISATGFQSGAIRACVKTNITLTDLDGLKETAREDLIAFVIHRIETRVIELKYELNNLFTYSQTGPQSWSSKPLDGVNGVAVLEMIGSLVALEFGFDQVRLKRPTYVIGYEDYDPAVGPRRIAVDSLQSFVDEALKVISKTESMLLSLQYRQSTK